jgi:3-phosphoshikimate 1-carboxyvinyltransferase
MANLIDPNELMFKKFGIQVEIESLSDKRELKIFPVTSISGTEINIPADFSSAAFLILAALITPDSDLTLKNVGLNPSRTALLGVLKEMGADISISNFLDDYEPCGDLKIKSSRLKFKLSINSCLASCDVRIPVSIKFEISFKIFSELFIITLN